MFTRNTCFYRFCYVIEMIYWYVTYN